MGGVDDKSLTENSAATNRTSLWGGRFAGGPSEALARLSVSVQFDWRLAPYDIAGSRAHARVLAGAGLLTPDELGRMLAALDDLEAACASGEFRPTVEDEDVHTALERGLLERLGTLGGKLRAGRSRNDQVATDLRLYLRDHARGVAARLIELADALADQAGAHVDTPAPGMTHLQHAQPVTFGHWLLAHVQPLLRDLDRLRDWDARTSVSPLGSGALAGSSLPLDPAGVAKELGFARPAANSMDAVADRDFVAEFLFITALIGVHLSRLGEEVVLWTSQEFGWVELDDAFATGSSIMPQKRNPDAAELVRGKAGRVFGTLQQMLTMMKGLPLTYSKDMQEDKEGTFHGLQTLSLCLAATTGMVRDMQPDLKVMKKAAGLGYATATDLADWLVRVLKMPFRDAHHVTGRLVGIASEKKVGLEKLTLAEMQAVEPKITDAVFAVLGVEQSVKSRVSYGGTAPANVRRQAARWLKKLAKERG